MGIGAENSGNLYSCMGYFANSPSEARRRSRPSTSPSTATRRRSWRRSAPTAIRRSTSPRRCSTRPAPPTPRSSRPRPRGCAFDSASGRVTMHGRQVDKDMYLAHCKGTEFEVIKTIKAVKSGTACKV